MINFKNKKILVTGATGGIGREIVKKFVEKINKDFQSYYEFFDCSEINEIDKNLNLLIDKQKSIFLILLCRR